MKLNSLTHTLLILIAVVGVSYVALYFSKAEAVYSRTVGTISVSKFVPNASGEAEFVVLQFSGILGQDSNANFDGWLLKNEAGFEFDLSNVKLSNTDSVRICEENSADPGCDYYWTGNDVFDDTAGHLQVVARDGTPVIHVYYDNPAQGEFFSGSGVYFDDVYTNGDKVAICDTQKGGALKARSMNARKLARDYDSDLAEGSDIVPPFVYEANKKLGFYPGINWPEGKGVLANGCN